MPAEVLDENGLPLLPCSAAKADGLAGSRSSRSRRRAARGDDTLECDVAVRFMREMIGLRPGGHQVPGDVSYCQAAVPTKRRAIAMGGIHGKTQRRRQRSSKAGIAAPHPWRD